MGERVLCKHEVVGSIPIASTRFTGGGDRLECLIRKKTQDTSWQLGCRQALAGAIPPGFLDIVKRVFL